MSVRNQHILVTGASRGIGAAIARELLEQGARLALHAFRNPTETEKMLAAYPDSGSIGLVADLGDMDQVQGLFREAVTRLGHLDAVVLNAGIFLPHPVGESPEAWQTAWRRTLAVNLDAPGQLTRLALEHFKDRGGGRLIYMGSRSAFRGETADYLAYSASKGGLTSLARSVARSFGKDNIKAFVLAPGFTRTDMADSYIRQHGEAELLKDIALGSLTRPEDIAPLVAFLCSGRMDHATGTVIDLNAGSYMH